MRLTLSRIRDCLGAVGDLFEAEDMFVTRVSTDSRLCSEGALFVCLSGQNFAGHKFAPEAVRRGVLDAPHLRNNPFALGRDVTRPDARGAWVSGNPEPGRP